MKTRLVALYLRAGGRAAAVGVVGLALIAGPATDTYAQSCTAPSFGASGVVYPTLGNNTQDMAVADFNNDGILDVATAEVGAAAVHVLLGTGSGFGLPAANFFTFVSSVVAADFNHDGNVDLAVSGSDANVRVAFGNGTGAFGVPSVFPVGVPAGPMDTGDVNNDGNLDIVFGSANPPPRVTALLGDGLGGFAAGGLALMPVGTDLAVRDVNHDGNLDVVTVDGATNQVGVTLGLGRR